MVQDTNFKGPRNEYILEMTNIDCPNCPDDFKEVYSNHIKAWKFGKKIDIERTWDKVVNTALSYGIRR